MDNTNQRVLLENIKYIEDRFFKDDGTASDDELRMSLDAMKKALGKWIPVSEGLPEQITDCFKSKDCFITDGKKAWVAAYNHSAYYWQCPSGDITHWQEIILPDKETK